MKDRAPAPRAPRPRPPRRTASARRCATSWTRRRRWRCVDRRRPRGGAPRAAHRAQDPARRLRDVRPALRRASGTASPRRTRPPPRRPREAPAAAARPRAALGPRHAARWRDAPAPSGEGDEPGYSPEALLRRKPFDEDWSAADLAAMERAAGPPGAAPGHAAQPPPGARRRGRGRADVRAQLPPRAAHVAASCVSLARRTRAVDEPRLVFLCDTSGSMDAAQPLPADVRCSRCAAPRPRAEVFAFNTELVHLTRSLAPRQASALTLDRLARGGARLVGRHAHRRVPRRVRRRSTWRAGRRPARPWSWS